MYTLVYIIPGTGVQEHIFFNFNTYMQINNLFNIQSSEHLHVELHEASHVHMNVEIYMYVTSCSMYVYVEHRI